MPHGRVPPPPPPGTYIPLPYEDPSAYFIPVQPGYARATDATVRIYPARQVRPRRWIAAAALAAAAVGAAVVVTMAGGGTRHPARPSPGVGALDQSAGDGASQRGGLDRQEAMRSGLLTPSEIGAGWVSQYATDQPTEGSGTGCEPLTSGALNGPPGPGQLEAEQDSALHDALPVFGEFILTESPASMAHDWATIATGLPKCTHASLDAGSGEQLAVRFSPVRFTVDGLPAVASRLDGSVGGIPVTAFFAVVRIDTATLVACMYTNAPYEHETRAAETLVTKAVRKARRTLA